MPVLASPLTGPDTHTKGPARGLRRGEGAHGFGGSIRSIFFRRNNPAIIRNGRASASLRPVVESRLPSQRPRPSPASGSEGPRRVGGRLPSSRVPTRHAVHVRRLAAGRDRTSSVVVFLEARRPPSFSNPRSLCSARVLRASPSVFPFWRRL